MHFNIVFCLFLNFMWCILVDTACFINMLTREKALILSYCMLSMRLPMQKYFHPRNYQLLRMWFVVFYLNQIGVHDNQLMLLPQNCTWSAWSWSQLYCNWSFTLTTSNNKWNRLWRLKNGIPQESVLTPLLFNIYTFDLPITISKKYTYTGDPAIMLADGDWQALEEVLSMTWWL